MPIDQYLRVRVFDTETTGLTNSDRIVEAGYHDILVGQPENVLDHFDSAVFNPGIKCSPGAREIHKITDEEIATGFDYEMRNKFLHHKSPDVFVAHNMQFDMKFFDFQGKPLLCTLKCARKVWPNSPSYKNFELLQWKMIDVDMSRCEPSHRALPDTYVTANLLLEMLKVRELSQLIEMSGFTVDPRKITFGRHAGKFMFDKSVPNNDLLWMRDTAQNLRHDVKQAAANELERRLQNGA